MLTRVACFVVFFLPFQIVVAQSNGANTLPTVAANSNAVDIKIDDGPYLEGAWHLDPLVNPDVFVIGSALPYGSKRITFKTDVDEITFDVTAGNEYDFVFMLNGDTPCHTRIWARPDPAVWNWQFLIPVCLFLLVVGGVVLARWKTLPIQPMLWCGVLAPICFWSITFASAFIRGEYNHLKNVVSQLGEIGSAAEVFTSVALVVLSVVCVLFSIGFFKASQKLGISSVPSVLTLSMPVLMIWAALFPLKNDLHGILGPLPLFLNAAALLAYVLWRKHENLTSVARWSLVGFAFMMLLLLLFAGPFAQHYEGLVQRFWYFGWSLWFVSLGFQFSQLTRQRVRINQRLPATD